MPQVEREQKEGEKPLTFSEEVGLLVLALLEIALENPHNKELLKEIKRK